MDVVITGTNFGGASAVSFGTGVAINRVTVLSSNQITANITIVVSTATGARGVSVTTPGGTSALLGSFIIKQAPPSINSLSPNQGNQGATMDVIIAGTNFGGASAVSFGTGVDINNYSNRSPTQIAVNISIDKNATSGARDVLVTTPGGTSTLNGSFTVKEKPLGAVHIALIWTGIAMVVALFGFTLNRLRRKGAARL